MADVLIAPKETRKTRSQNSAESESTQSGRTKDLGDKSCPNLTLAAISDKKENDGDYTTIMLRNIPNKYTREMLVKELRKQGFTGKYDFLYLPTDFANDANPGYCFVDFRSNDARKQFEDKFNGKSVQDVLPAFKSHKICQVTKAKYQGLEENVHRLRESTDLMKRLAVRPQCTPLMFDDQGNQLLFETPDVTVAEMSSLNLDVKADAPRPKTVNSKGKNGDKSKVVEKGRGKCKGKGKSNVGKETPTMTDQDIQAMASIIGKARAIQARRSLHDAYLYAYRDWMSAAIDSYWWNGHMGSSWNESDDYWEADWNYSWPRSTWASY